MNAVSLGSSKKGVLHLTALEIRAYLVELFSRVVCNLWKSSIVALLIVPPPAVSTCTVQQSQVRQIRTEEEFYRFH